MLAEWLTHLTTPCDKTFKSMGYLGELIAIKYRHKRCRQAWQPHLEACKAFITEASNQTEKTGSAVVLGSGQLLDIPLAPLARRFDQVYLVDVCHLASSRRQVREFSNIHFIETDISGTVEALQAWDLKGAIPDPAPTLPLLTEADYVVSSNLLAQLPLAPLQFLKNRNRSFTDLELDNFSRLVMAAHMKLLEEAPGCVTLISEVLHTVSDGDQTLDKSDPLEGVRFPVADQEWDWALAPRPELSPAYDLTLRVAAIADLRKATYERTCRKTTLAAP